MMMSPATKDAVLGMTKAGFKRSQFLVRYGFVKGIDQKQLRLKLPALLATKRLTVAGYVNGVEITKLVIWNGAGEFIFKGDYENAGGCIYQFVTDDLQRVILFTNRDEAEEELAKCEAATIRTIEVNGQADLNKHLAHPPIHDYEGYSWFMYNFDVNKAWRMIEVGREVRGINVKSFYDTFFKGTHYDGGDNIGFMGGLSKGVDYALSDLVDTSIPVLAAEIPAKLIGRKGNETMNWVIDGWHRMYKAYHEGKETQEAYILSPDEVLQIHSR